jgi:cytochrome c oxidase subunit 4
MSDDHAANVDKHVRTYLMVFGSLIVLTFATVGASHLDLGILGGIVLALFIATIKGSLVACYFMHLISEKKLILYVLLLTVTFFSFLVLLPVMTSIADQAAN